MYESHFGFRHRPFRSTPDSASYYPATGHEQALAAIQGGLADDEGVLVVTGPPGSGKTLLGHRLIEQLGDEVESIFLPFGQAGGRAGLLQAILFDLKLPYEGRPEAELRLAVIDALLTLQAAGKRVLLLVDEAQGLSVDQLDELRLLSNLEAGAVRVVQIILLAHPGLLETLHRPEMASLSQRITIRSELRPFGLEEAVDYLLHQVRAAGGKAETILSDEALDLLARGSLGVPRLLNQLGQLALRLAFAGETATVDAEVALEALATLNLGVPDTDADDTLLGVPLPDRSDPLAAEETDESDLTEYETALRLPIGPRDPA